MALPQSADGWSALCDCGILLSYSFTFFLIIISELSFIVDSKQQHYFSPIDLLSMKSISSLKLYLIYHSISLTLMLVHMLEDTNDCPHQYICFTFISYVVFGVPYTTLDVASSFKSDSTLLFFLSFFFFPDVSLDCFSALEDIDRPRQK